jgi:hypothetical protein
VKHVIGRSVAHSTFLLRVERVPVVSQSAVRVEQRGIAAATSQHKLAQLYTVNHCSGSIISSPLLKTFVVLLFMFNVLCLVQCGKCGFGSNEL